MLDNILLVLTSIFIPFIILISLRLYNYKNDQKLSKILIIITLSLELFRFFYNASFYDKAKTPSGYLTFSFITFLIVFGLFAIFNHTKLKVFFKKVFALTCLIPTTFALFASRVYESEIVDGKPLDTYTVLPCLYFIECGLLITIGIIFIKQMISDNVKSISFSMLYGILVYVLYTLVSIATKFAWEIQYDFDINFYLSIGCSLLSIIVVYLFLTICSTKTHKKVG